MPAWRSLLAQPAREERGHGSQSHRARPPLFGVRPVPLAQVPPPTGPTGAGAGEARRGVGEAGRIGAPGAGKARGRRCVGCRCPPMGHAPGRLGRWAASRRHKSVHRVRPLSVTHPPLRFAHPSLLSTVLLCTLLCVEGGAIERGYFQAIPSACYASIRRYLHADTRYSISSDTQPTLPAG